MCTTLLSAHQARRVSVAISLCLLHLTLTGCEWQAIVDGISPTKSRMPARKNVTDEAKEGHPSRPTQNPCATPDAVSFAKAYAGPKEIQAILEGKQFIERVTDDLSNPMMDFVSPNPIMHNTHRWMEAPPEKFYNQALKYGSKHVILKSGYEYLSSVVPAYVIFHEPMDLEAIKKSGKKVKEVWVNSSHPNCDNREIVWCGGPTCTAKYPQISATDLMFQIETDFRAKNSQDFPSCSLSLAIKAYCRDVGLANSRRNGEQFDHIIIRIKGGKYHEEHNNRLCDGMILTNENNETVEFDSFKDITASSPDGPWVELDATSNLWGVKWDSHPSMLTTIKLDGEFVTGVNHFDDNTIALDRQAPTPPGVKGAGYTDLAMVKQTGPVFRWVDVSEDGAAAIKRAEIAESLKAQNKFPPHAEVANFCSTDNYSVDPAATLPKLSPFDDLWLMWVKTGYHGLSKSNCAPANAKAQFEDPRAAQGENICHWSTPLPNMQGGGCLPNYPWITSHLISKHVYFEKFAAKLGAKTKFLVLKLPAGHVPSKYKSINANFYTGGGFYVFQNHNNKNKPAYESKNITVRGLRLMVPVKFPISAHPLMNPLAAGEHLFHVNGVEFQNTGSISVANGPTSGIRIANSYFNHMGYAIAMYAMEKDVEVSNNYFYKTGDKTIHVEESPLTAEQIYQEPLGVDAGKWFILNSIHRGGGFDFGNFAHWRFEFNHLYRGGGQEMMEPIGSLFDSRISNNWFEDDAQFGIGIQASGGKNAPIVGLEISNNQFIRTPTGEGKSGKNYACTNAIGVDEGPYLYSPCEQLQIRNNLIAGLQGGSGCMTAFSVPTFCKNSSFSHNLVDATGFAGRAGAIAGYYTGMENFEFAHNIILSPDSGNTGRFEITTSGVNNNSAAWNPSPGEFLERCLKVMEFKTNACSNARDLAYAQKCTALANQNKEASAEQKQSVYESCKNTPDGNMDQEFAKCKTQIEDFKTKTCTPDLNAKIKDAFVNPTEFKAFGNYLEKCNSDPAVNKKHCSNIDFPKRPLLFDPENGDYHLSDAHGAGGFTNGFVHAGVNYLDERGGKVPPKTAYAGRNPDQLMEDVNASRGFTTTAPSCQSEGQNSSQTSNEIPTMLESNPDLTEALSAVLDTVAPTLPEQVAAAKTYGKELVTALAQGPLTLTGDAKCYFEGTQTYKFLKIGLTLAGEMAGKSEFKVTANLSVKDPGFTQLAEEQTPDEVLNAILKRQVVLKNGGLEVTYTFDGKLDGFSASGSVDGVSNNGWTCSGIWDVSKQ